MTPARKVTTFRVDPDVEKAMEALRERDGIPLSEQIRRALRAWLESKRVIKKAGRKRVVRASTRSMARWLSTSRA
jgi:Arc/MetJ-type ribon-helix-helix transcriptional regulator